jgi:hypothetical protein
MCDPVAQTGCGPNEKCSLGQMGTICLSDGDKLVGQLCDTAGSDDCIHGLLCSNEAAANQCRQFCKVDSDCTQPASGSAQNPARCVEQYMGTTAMTCSVPCNPVSKVGPAGCAAGLGCGLFAVASTMVMATDCTGLGSGIDGADCKSSSRACASGYACVTGSSGAPLCRQVCRAGTPGDCSGAGYLCAVPTGPSPPWGFCCPGTGC